MDEKRSEGSSPLPEWILRFLLWLCFLFMLHFLFACCTFSLHAAPAEVTLIALIASCSAPSAVSACSHRTFEQTANGIGYSAA
ncbi:hypothetical protein [Paenibacillus sp. P22]|uniref:hypothetical protein n=1 Tax=Paenibacillus sp. P22 TaxID=483908 RepID=UPI0012EEB7E4|nr:hypothetical protein [Paenibacillus sp. P22]